MAAEDQPAPIVDPGAPYGSSFAAAQTGQFLEGRSVLSAMAAPADSAVEAERITEERLAEAANTPPDLKEHVEEEKG